MGQKLSAADQRLYRAIDEVLHYVWDPIGVSQVPQARDEYHAYLPHVFGLVRNEAPVNEICSYLNSVVTKRMGLAQNIEHDRKVVDVLLEWRAAIHAQQG